MGKQPSYRLLAGILEALAQPSALLVGRRARRGLKIHIRGEEG